MAGYFWSGGLNLDQRFTESDCYYCRELLKSSVISKSGTLLKRSVAQSNFQAANYLHETKAPKTEKHKATGFEPPAAARAARTGRLRRWSVTNAVSF